MSTSMRLAAFCIWVLSIPWFHAGCLAVPVAIVLSLWTCVWLFAWGSLWFLTRQGWEGANCESRSMIGSRLPWRECSYSRECLQSYRRFAHIVQQTPTCWQIMPTTVYPMRELMAAAATMYWLARHTYGSAQHMRLDCCTARLTANNWSVLLAQAAAVLGAASMHVRWRLASDDCCTAATTWHPAAASCCSTEPTSLLILCSLTFLVLVFCLLCCCLPRLLHRVLLVSMAQQAGT